MTTMQKYSQHFQTMFLIIIIHYKIHEFVIQNQIITYTIQTCIIIFLVINKFIQIISFLIKQQCQYKDMKKYKLILLNKNNTLQYYYSTLHTLLII